MFASIADGSHLYCGLYAAALRRAETTAGGLRCALAAKTIELPRKHTSYIMARTILPLWPLSNIA